MGSWSRYDYHSEAMLAGGDAQSVWLEVGLEFEMFESGVFGEWENGVQKGTTYTIRSLASKEVEPKCYQFPEMDHWDKTPYAYTDASGEVRHGNPNQSSSNNVNL